MMEVTVLSIKYNEQLRKLMPDIFSEYLYHGDVIPDSACVVTNAGKALGMGFLLSCTESEEEVYLAEYEVTSACDGEMQAMAASLLLDALVTYFDDNLAGRLRVFADEKHEAYRKFLADFLFEEGYRMLRMERSLSEASAPCGCAKENAADEGIPGPDTCVKECETAAFVKSAAASFSEGISERELCYRCAYCDGKLYAIYESAASKESAECERAAAGVMIYPLAQESALAEFVFCVPERRRQGLATRLLNEVMAILSGEGYKKVMLYVKAENEGAVKMYENLGFTTTGVLYEMYTE